MATLTVGPGKQYATVAAAIAASHDGDILKVQAGTYTNDFAEIRTKITLQGVGGMVKMVATRSIPNGKAILITDTNVTIDHFEFSGAKVSSGNGAGIRYQGGALTLTNDYFHNNQDGLLGGASSTGTITISRSEFGFNGANDGLTHNIYVGDIARLTIDNSYVHDALGGNEIKSRAEQTYIANTRVFDLQSNASYSIDIPNGGIVNLNHDFIQQGKNSPNSNIIEIGAEGSLHAGSLLRMNDNTVVNDLGRGTMLWNAGGSPATVTNTSVWGSMTLVKGSNVTITNTIRLTSRPNLDKSSPWQTTATTPAADTHTDAAHAASVGVGGADADRFVLKPGPGHGATTDLAHAQGDLGLLDGASGAHAMTIDAGPGLAPALDMGAGVLLAEGHNLSSADLLLS